MKASARAEQGYRMAERITKARAKSFAFASIALDRDARRSAFAVYAFCRGCDDAVDEGGLSADVLADRTRDLRERARSVYAGEPQRDPVLEAFRDAVERHRIPFAAVSELIDGMERDLVQKRYASYAELESYCQQAAGTVGIMMASIFGAHGDEALASAAALGRAMQLTNVLRDVREDLLEHDRVYLPTDMLAREGLVEADLAAFARAGALSLEKGEAFRSVMRDLAHRARLLYAWADEGIPMIPSRNARACVHMMRSSYAEILRVLDEQAWDPFAGRARASLRRKIKATARDAAVARIPHPLRLVLPLS